MLVTDIGTARAYVDVERSCARKVQYNARGVTGLRCNLNLRHYYKTHYGNLPAGEDTNLVLGSVFHNSKYYHMIVTSVQTVVGVIQDDLRIKVYKTIQDPVTMKEVVACEIYTVKGVIENTNDRGLIIDKKV